MPSVIFKKFLVAFGFSYVKYCYWQMWSWTDLEVFTVCVFVLYSSALCKPAAFTFRGQAICQQYRETSLLSLWERVWGLLEETSAYAVISYWYSWVDLDITESLGFVKSGRLSIVLLSASAFHRPSSVLLSYALLRAALLWMNGGLSKEVFPLTSPRLSKVEAVIKADVKLIVPAPTHMLGWA